MATEILIEDVLAGIANSSLAEIVAMAAGFWKISEELILEYPNPDDAPAPVVDFVNKVAELGLNLADTLQLTTKA